MVRQEKAQGAFLVALAIMVTLLALTLVWSTYEGTRTHSELCSSQDKTLAVMTSILTSAQSQTDQNPKISVTQKAASDKFVTQQLLTITAARC